MNKKATCPDPTPVLAGLKDFQRNTVEYVFRRLYLDTDASNRFLVADEVGLGKTLIARGVIAKAIEHLWDKVKRIDIVYICSNADIARQNIQRLNITGAEDFSLASRITLLPLQLHNLQENRINFVSFTPGTSFDLKSSLGTMEERATLYWLLHPVWDFQDKAAPKNVFQGRSGRDSFREYLKEFRWNRQIDESLAERFRQRLEQQIVSERQAGKPDLQSRFTALRNCFNHARDSSSIPAEEKWQRSHLIGELRLVLAKACVSALEPDLIILDEFQRFKHLLNPEDDFNEIAHELFNFSDIQSPAKVVLLSATPYKMYTLAHEAAADNHYEDFLKTIQFLQSDKTQTDLFEELLRQYRQELLRLGKGHYDRLLALKSKLEYELRRVMVRTERLAASPDRDGMLAEIPCRSTKLEPQDLEAYLGLQNIARILGQHDTLEYWKSAPYLLNFMDNYELKRSFTQAIETPHQTSPLASALSTRSNLLLSRQEFSTYAKVDPSNARLRGLLADTIGVGAWKLLWIPPSLTYYQLGGAFAESNLTKFTKRLIFSSWRVVPKMIATLLSYEAERQMIGSFEDAPENTPEARKRRRPLLRFARTSDGIVLAKECDPLTFAANSDNSESPVLSDLLPRIQQKIETLLQALAIECPESGIEDESWYWVAPILLDRHFDPEATHRWFATPDLAKIWTGEDQGQHDEEQGESLWAEHIKMAKGLVDAPFPQLGKPPSDLSLVLAQMAIASPGIVALRALTRITGGSIMLTNSDIRNSAAQTAWSFRTLFNSPESTALIRGINSEEPYWHQVLEYCVDGCLQSVLDEHTHLLRESLGLSNEPPSKVATEVSRAISKALTLRTSVMQVDEIIVGTKQVKMIPGNYRMRGHFALRFGEEKPDDEKVANRTEQVREAFNSPFRPFVLATTSVGQEGLDFHPYCHAIVHWNLPSNPVDLEQREGRIHRYKGHAVRKNLALNYGISETSSSENDPWESLFAAGKRDRSPESSDLIPFWIYPLENGAKIERYVPNFPLSRDCERLEALRRSLAVYRMVFGQSRQEDLLAYLRDRLPKSEAEQVIYNLQFNLEPR
jgi:Helicase conserved C-terminal domain